MELTLLALLGALVALDGTSVGQFMVSRPLVTGPLAGWVLGDPVLGLLVGGILELYFIPVFPVGGGDFPEGGPPAVVAVAAAAALPGAGGVALGVFLGFLWSRLGMASTAVFRRVNGLLVPDPARVEASPLRIVGAQVGAISLDFVRGGVLTLLGLLVAGWTAPRLEGIWPLGPSVTLSLLALGASIPAGGFLQVLGGWKGKGLLFGMGVLGSVLAGWVL